MRYVAWVALGIVLGFLLGGVGPRRKNAELSNEIQGLQQDLKQAKRGGTRPLFPFPGLDWRRSGDSAPSASGAARSNPTSGSDGNRPTSSPDDRRDRGFWWFGRRGRRRDDDDGKNTEQRMAAFDAAATAQRARTNQAKAALIEQAQLTDPQVQTLDGLIERLNTRLKPHADQLAQIVESDQPPEPGEFLWLSKEVTGILSDGQTELEQTVGPDKLDKVDRSSREIWNYVDLQMFRPAAEARVKRGFSPGTMPAASAPADGSQ